MVLAALLLQDVASLVRMAAAVRVRAVAVLAETLDREAHHRVAEGDWCEAVRVDDLLRLARIGAAARRGGDPRPREREGERRDACRERPVSPRRAPHRPLSAGSGRRAGTSRSSPKG